MTRKRIHGKSRTAAYYRWQNMMARCYRPGNHKYRLYGGRGIAVCERWHSSVHFLEDMGEPPPGHSLDRINTNGDYSPDNCRWADASTQMGNRRLYSISDSPNRYITKRGNSYRVAIKVRGNTIGGSRATLEDAQSLRDEIEYERVFHSMLGL